jgi:hypothetical protein
MFMGRAGVRQIVAFGERGRLDRCFRRLAENLGTIRILTEW